MPCDGIAVLTAETSADLEKHFAEPLHREQCADWLNEQGIATHGWYEVGNSSLWALDLTASGSASLCFRGSSVQVMGRLSDQKTGQVLDLALTYAGQIAQQQVVEALVTLGFTPQALSYTNGGELSFAINIGG